MDIPFARIGSFREGAIINATAQSIEYDALVCQSRQSTELQAPNQKFAAWAVRQFRAKFLVRFGLIH
jgi:hypothetical protein